MFLSLLLVLTSSTRVAIFKVLFEPKISNLILSTMQGKRLLSLYPKPIFCYFSKIMLDGEGVTVTPSSPFLSSEKDPAQTEGARVSPAATGPYALSSSM